MLNRVGPSMCVVTKRHALRDSELSKKNLRVLQSEKNNFGKCQHFAVSIDVSPDIS